MAAEESTPGQRKRTRRELARRSDVWEHFILFTDDPGNKKARCKRCGQVLNASQGTSSPKKHVKICTAQPAAVGVVAAAALPPPPRASLDEANKHLAQSSDPASFAPSAPQPPQLLLLLQSQPDGSSGGDREPAGLEVEEACRDLAQMELHGYDLEDNCFRSFVRRLNPGFELPSREAIKKMRSGIFQDFRREQKFRSKHISGKLSVAVGQSKTIETGQVVYTTTHFIDLNWNLHREVYRVIMALPDGDHYHFPLGQVTAVSLDDAVDNIVTAIARGGIFELFMIAGETTGHINHLKLKGCIQEKGLAVYSATWMDHVLHSIARCLLPDSEFAKYIKFIMEAWYDHLLEQDEISTKLSLAKFGLLDHPWEYDERWYSCYCSLEILRQKNIELVPHDCTDQLLCTLWQAIYQLLCTLWGAIYRAIIKVSDCSRPTSNLCLQELFKLRDVLQSQLSKASAAHAGHYSGFGDKNVADVLRKALETVDKAIQDSYLVWSIPLVLDPRYKLSCIKDSFERAFGLSEAEKYVSEVSREIKELYNSYNEDGDDDEDSDGSTEEMLVDSTTQLDRYLQDSRAPETEGFDILNWWKVHGSVYPTVAWMARDALAMPTCSKLSSDQMAHVRILLRGYDSYGW